jgi:hypothetical protein
MSSNRHHRKPRSLGGETNRHNCVMVNARRHYFWHQLFGNMNGWEIAREINTLWLDPEFKVVHIKEGR